MGEVDRESDRIDSTEDLARETTELRIGTSGPDESEKKPLISPVVKWVLLADLVIAVAAVTFFLAL